MLPVNQYQVTQTRVSLLKRKAKSGDIRWLLSQRFPGYICSDQKKKEKKSNITFIGSTKHFYTIYWRVR